MMNLFVVVVCNSVFEVLLDEVGCVLLLLVVCYFEKGGCCIGYEVKE